MIAAISLKNGDNSLTQANIFAYSLSSATNKASQKFQFAVTRIISALLLSILALQLAYYYRIAVFSYPSILLGASIYTSFELRILGVKKLALLSWILLLGLLGLASTWQQFVSPNNLASAHTLLNQGSSQNLCFTVGKVEQASKDASYKFRAVVSPHTKVRGLSSLEILLQGSMLELAFSTPVKGEALCARVRLRSLLLKNGALPFVGSYKGKLLRKGIALTGRVEKIWYRPNIGGIKLYSVDTLRLLSEFPQFHSSALVYAAILARKDILSEPIWKLFQELGISHLLVVSGFHLLVVSLLLNWLTRKIISRFTLFYRFGPIDRISTLLGLAGVWIYFAILPTALPVLRAVLASSLLICALRKTRKLYPLRSLAIVAIILLILEPASLLDVGPQLTFLALFGLWLGARIDSEYPLRKGHPVIAKLRLMLLLSFGASLMTSPIVLLYFELFVPLAPFISAFISPIFSVLVIIPGGILLFLDLVFNSVPSLVWQCYLESVDLFISFLEVVANILQHLGLGVRLKEELSWYACWSVCILPMLVGAVFLRFLRSMRDNRGEKSERL